MELVDTYLISSGSLATYFSCSSSPSSTNGTVLADSSPAALNKKKVLDKLTSISSKACAVYEQVTQQSPYPPSPSD
jgi:hypothetical protein